MMEPEITQKETRCPRLGSIIPFSYCMKCGDGRLPCGKVIDCWWEIFDIKGYLEQHLSAEDFQELVNRKPKDKVSSILEMIEQAKKK
ncbi:MAG: hypothetical protein ABIK15_18260 [Pseudomonadota bacterium]